MKEVKVAVWGLGLHAIKNILPALKICPGLTLYGVCSRNLEVVAKYADEFNCLGWTNSIQMLEDPIVDIIYLSTPIGLHAAQGKSVLLANKHLWCEKPLAETFEQVSMLVNLSRERNVTIAEGFMYLYHSQFIYIQEIINSGILGHIHNISCRFGIPPLDQPGFRLNPKLGGGALLDVGSYPMSAITSFFPKLTPQVLFSELTTADGSSVDSNGRAILCYENGTRATLEWGTNCAYRNEIDLWGSRGSVSTERFFSKSPDYIPKFRFLDLNGRENYKSGQSENHFLSMFNAFSKSLFNSVQAENERIMITHRAKILDQIRQSSIYGEYNGKMEKCDAR